MALVTHLVVAYDHDTKTFAFDGDGSREWIRRLYTPETNTWSDDAGEFVAIETEVEKEAIDALEAIGVNISDNHLWQIR